MKFLMLCREPRLYSCQRLKSAAEKLGHQLDILDPNRFILELTQRKLAYRYPSAEMFEQTSVQYDGIIPRFGTASTEMGCNVLYHFELQGIPVLNKMESFRLARNKWQSLQKLASIGIAVPKSVLAGELVHSKQLIQDFSCPFIIKTLSGSQGIGVMLVESQSSAIGLLDTLNMAKINTLSQQFIAESQGEDIRAFVIGDKVVATMSRQGASGDFRANIHQGGKAKVVELSIEEQHIAIRATQSLGLDVAGVDLIRSNGGSLVLEVNASPGLEMIEKVSGVDIATQMIQALLQKN